MPTAVLVAPRVTLFSLRARPAAINFWASWCEPCREEAPALEQVALTLHGRARLVGVNWNDSLSGARSFVREYHPKFPMLRDSSGAVGYDYGINGLPTTFILNPRGEIVETLRGPQRVSSLRQALARAR